MIKLSVSDSITNSPTSIEASKTIDVGQISSTLSTSNSKEMSIKSFSEVDKSEKAKIDIEEEIKDEKLGKVINDKEMKRSSLSTEIESLISSSFVEPFIEASISSNTASEAISNTKEASDSFKATEKSESLSTTQEPLISVTKSLINGKTSVSASAETHKEIPDLKSTGSTGEEKERMNKAEKESITSTQEPFLGLEVSNFATPLRPYEVPRVAPAANIVEAKSDLLAVNEQNATVIKKNRQVHSNNALPG